MHALFPNICASNLNTGFHPPDMGGKEDRVRKQTRAVQGSWGQFAIKRPAYLPPSLALAQERNPRRGCAVRSALTIISLTVSSTIHKEVAKDTYMNIAHRTLGSAERMDLYRVIVGFDNSAITSSVCVACGNSPVVSLILLGPTNNRTWRL